MDNHKGYLFFLEVFLDFILVIGILLLVIFPLTIVFSETHFSALDIRIGAFSLIDIIFYLLIVYELKGILNRIFKKEIFIIDNVKSFKKMGYYIFIIGFMDMINNIISGGLKMIFVLNRNGSIKPDICMFIILGCVALITADIFKKAIEIKDENDLTV